MSLTSGDPAKKSASIVLLARPSPCPQRSQTKADLFPADDSMRPSRPDLRISLWISANPVGMGALSRLREKDPLLSDYVAGKAMDALGAQSTLTSLPGLHWLATYIFPGPDAPISSIEAQSSLDALQFKFFLASFDVLQA